MNNKLLEMFRVPSYSSRVGQVPYIIAEAGVNHEGDIGLAKRLVREASVAGADAIKFQSYKASSLASIHSPAYWDRTKEPTSSQYDLFKKYDNFGKAEFEEIKRCCDDHNIEFMSTPFDRESAKYLSELVNVFKISSSDITNKPFIEIVCGYGKPIILSTGASNATEIEEAVSWIDASGVPVALMHCVLNYPTENKNAYLGMIIDMRNMYPERLVGYSDHTLPGEMKVLEIATLLGAQIIEKHFTHDKTLPGNDHYHAMDINDLRSYLDNMKNVFEIVGEKEKQSLDVESVARRNARRSLVAVRKILRGAPVSEDDLTWKRPATGISPKYVDEVIGRITVKEIQEDEVITWDALQ